MMLAWVCGWPCCAMPTSELRCGARGGQLCSSAVMLAPFVYELIVTLAHAAAGTAEHRTAPRCSTLSVRRMIDSGLLTGLPIFAAEPARIRYCSTRRYACSAAAGAGDGVGRLWGRARAAASGQAPPSAEPVDAARDTSLFFTLCGLVMVLFISSSVMSNNDFGYRAVMLPQFFLLLLTADVLGSWWIPGKAQPSCRSHPAGGGCSPACWSWASPGRSTARFCCAHGCPSRPARAERLQPATRRCLPDS